MIRFQLSPSLTPSPLINKDVRGTTREGERATIEVILTKFEKHQTLLPFYIKSSNMISIIPCDKKISFKPIVTIHCVTSYKDESRIASPLWYTKEELKQLEVENKKIGRLMVQQQQQQPLPNDGQFQYSGAIESEDCTTRGLERFLPTSTSIRKGRRLRAMIAVLEEQDRTRLQQLYDSSSSLFDSNYNLAATYSLIAAPCKRDAENRALCDAQTVRKAISDDEMELQFSGANIFLSKDSRASEQYVRSSPVQSKKIASVAA